MRSFVVALLLVAIPAGKAVADLLWFDDEGDFVAAAVGAGLVLKGVEDFEESILPPSSYDAFDDPLESGVPNKPDGFPFPKGMTGLDNIKVQSNTLGGQPSQESPRGPNGLVASTAHFFYSEVLLANWFIDGWEIVFFTEDSHMAVGANTISVLGANSVDIRVYDKNNQFLGMNTFPANPQASHFFGVISDDLIGRINVFDLGNGAEGLDNIQAWIPEPATLSLLAFAALALVRRRSPGMVRSSWARRRIASVRPFRSFGTPSTACAPCPTCWRTSTGSI